MIMDTRERTSSSTVEQTHRFREFTKVCVVISYQIETNTNKVSCLRIALTNDDLLEYPLLYYKWTDSLNIETIISLLDFFRESDDASSKLYRLDLELRRLNNKLNPFYPIPFEEFVEHLKAM